MARRSRLQRPLDGLSVDTLAGEGINGMPVNDPAGRGWTPAPAVPYADPAQVRTSGQTAQDDPDLPYWLALNRVKGIGPARFRLLLDVFGSGEAAWRASPAEWQKAGIDARTVANADQQRARISPEAEFDTIVKLRVRALR